MCDIYIFYISFYFLSFYKMLSLLQYEHNAKSAERCLRLEFWRKPRSLLFDTNRNKFHFLVWRSSQTTRVQFVRQTCQVLHFRAFSHLHVICAKLSFVDTMLECTAADLPLSIWPLMYPTMHRVQLMVTNPTIYPTAHTETKMAEIQGI